MSVVIDGTLGITSPAETVQGALTTTGNTILGDASTDTLNVGNGGLVKDASGNVGIGTSSPLGKLKVTVGDVAPAASGNMNTGVIYEVASGSRAINFGVNNTAGYSWINAAFSNNSGVPDNLVLMTGATERMRIDSSGNVGIGTTSPASKLDVNAMLAGYGGNLTSPVATITGANCATNGGGNLRVFANTSAAADVGGSMVFGGYYSAQVASVDYAEIAGRKQTGQTTGGYLSFSTRADLGDQTERMRIDSSGNLLFNSGYGSVATAYGCRAWVNFDGTGTPAIRASGNVSSITDNGVGDYTVNLTTAMADTNGTVVGASVETIGAFTGGLRAVMPSFASTSTIRVGVCYTNGGAVDMPYVGISVFR